MKRFLLVFGIAVLWVAVTGGISYAVYQDRQGLKEKQGDLYAAGNILAGNILVNADRKLQSAFDLRDDWVRSAQEFSARTSARMDRREGQARKNFDSAKNKVSDRYDKIVASFNESADAVIATLFSVLDVPEHRNAKMIERPAQSSGFINASYSAFAPPPPLTLSEIKKRREEDNLARVNAQIAPAAAPPSSHWQPEQNELSVEAVLVPRQVTVISSSQDGRIADVLVGHGDTFKKGDLLITYDCSDLQAEADIMRMETDVTKRRAQGSDKLFKLDIISDVDRIGAQVEDRQAQAKAKLYDMRMKDCEIHAQFDGRVTNRLANPGEYTRTDRVLLEVASNDPLQAEFLVPSKWLRWVNVGAPLSITLAETEKTYAARILRIHGEVDPVSQSIQMIATLDPYDDPLLPGMSGQAKIDVTAIRNAGVKGYLEATPASYVAH